MYSGGTSSSLLRGDAKFRNRRLTTVPAHIDLTPVRKLVIEKMAAEAVVNKNRMLVFKNKGKDLEVSEAFLPNGRVEDRIDGISARVRDYICHLDGTPSCQMLPCTMMPFSLPRTRARTHSRSTASHPLFSPFLFVFFLFFFLLSLHLFSFFLLLTLFSSAISFLCTFFLPSPFAPFFFLFILSSIVFLPILLVASFITYIEIALTILLIH